MSATNSISADKLFRLIGTANCPTIVDVRTDADGLLPAAIRRPAETARDWAGALPGQKVVIFCVHGHERGAGVAAILRSEGVDAETLEGGFMALRGAGFPVVDAAQTPESGPAGRTVWVTRSRPKVARIACPWLIRRFVDPVATFLFVAPSEVPGVAER